MSKNSIVKNQFTIVIHLTRNKYILICTYINKVILLKNYISPASAFREHIINEIEAYVYKLISTIEINYDVYRKSRSSTDRLINNQVSHIIMKNQR